jgi:transglutaminase-like putative cysteine protease
MPQTDEDFSPRRYRVRHTTAYTYAGADVDACYERGMLSPRSTSYQRLETNTITIVPPPDLHTTHQDFFGNESHYVEVRTPHRRLEVSQDFVVAVDRTPPSRAQLDGWTLVDAAALLSPGADNPEANRTTRSLYLLPSEMVGTHPEVLDYARSLTHPGQSVGEAIEAITCGINDDFTFEKGVTSVETTLPELLTLRAGVCQDFTHLALGCLRALGLPARYVSGYIETIPPPGKPKLEGTDASHAWAAVLLPDGSWVETDPTNRQFVDSRYVVTAWGRDFADVSPLKGVIYTEASSSHLDVSVDVVRLPD